MPLPISRDIASLTPYSPGKPIEELERELGIQKAIKLASNENPLGPSKKALEAVEKVLTGLHRYPEGGGVALREVLADRVKVQPSQVVLGNGSNEIIELLVRSFMQPGDEAIMADLTFVVYQMIVKAAHGSPVRVPLHNGSHDLETMASRLTPKTRLIFICNPNNPTGTMVNRGQVDAFLRKIPDEVITVFDEAYYEYVTDRSFPDSLRYLGQGKNVAILRTFSKIYGLAGLRIGYGLTTEEIAGILNRVRQPFNTNRLAQVAALAALKDDDHVRRSLEVNKEGKAMLCDAFQEMGLQFLPTQTNFIYVDVGRPGQDVYSRLLRYGVIVRHIEGRYLRVTIGLPEENRQFIEVLKQVLLGKDSRSE
jgi:histidinol-phosphate aminotransferase